MEYHFDSPLVEGVILSRPNRFIMMIRLGSSVVKYRCPATRRIGDLIFQDVPCLLSATRRKSEGRMTRASWRPSHRIPLEVQINPGLG